MKETRQKNRIYPNVTNTKEEEMEKHGGGYRTKHDPKDQRSIEQDG